MALGYQRRLQPTLLILAVFAEQILGQLNFSCLLIFCFAATLKLQCGICTIIAGSRCQRPHQSELLTAAACPQQQPWKVGLFLKEQPLIGRRFLSNPLCLRHERGAEYNIKWIRMDFGNGVFLP